MRSTCGTAPGPAARAAVTVRPTRYGRSPAAVRKRVSPSGTQTTTRGGASPAGVAQDEPSISRDETGLEEERPEPRGRDVLTIDLAEDQLASPSVGHERAERSGGGDRHGWVVRRWEGLQRRPAAFEIERGDPVEQHDIGARGTL